MKINLPIAIALQMDISQKTLPKMPATVVALWGISGSGKTTVGRALANCLGWEFMDIDDYFWCRRGKPELMPRISLGGTVALTPDLSAVLAHHLTTTPPRETVFTPTECTNWDSEDAIDWEGFATDVKRKTRNVVLVGFCLPPKRMPVPVSLTIELRITNNEETLLREVFAARLRTKQGNNWCKDLLMVKNIIIPFYHEQVWKMLDPEFIYVFRRGQRVRVEDLVTAIVGKMNHA